MYVWNVPPVLPRLTILGFRCKRYVFMETLETMLLTFTAEVFLTLRYVENIRAALHTPELG